MLPWGGDASLRSIVRGFGYFSPHLKRASKSRARALHQGKGGVRSIFTRDPLAGGCHASGVKIIRFRFLRAVSLLYGDRPLEGEAEGRDQVRAGNQLAFAAVSGPE